MDVRLTTLAHDLLSQTDWKSVVAGTAYLSQADDLLRSWVEDQSMTWIERSDARKHTGSVGKFAETILVTYFDAVEWEDVTNTLKGQ